MKYLGWAVLIIVIVLLTIPTYMYLVSVDWSKSHTERISSLPLLESTTNSGEFRLTVGEFEFYVRAAGLQNEGPGVILLHGFPESSIMWEVLLDSASANGYRALAYDQRGYSPGARPKGAASYHIDLLTEDVLNVADAVGFDTFHLVGHDWGAAVGWNVAMHHEDRLLSWSALTIPHVGVFFDAIMNHPEQMERSSYMNRLRRRVLPEYAFVSNHQQFFRELMGGMPERHLNEYLALQAEHGAATATLNWYRAVDFDAMVNDATFKQPVRTPTLFIWGKNDEVIAPAVMPLHLELITGPFEEVVLDTGHALIQTKEDSVVTSILTHLGRNSPENNSSDMVN